MLTKSGWIIISGCGHSGIINTAKKLQLIHNLLIYLAIGGFHLLKASDDVIDKIARWLKIQVYKSLWVRIYTAIYAAERVADMPLKMKE